MPKTYYESVTIANGQTDSSSFDMNTGDGDSRNNLTLCGILIPDTFTGTSITFLANDEAEGAYKPIYDPAESADYTLPVAAGKWIPVDLTKMVLANYMKIKSSGAEGGLRTLKLAFRMVE